MTQFSIAILKLTAKIFGLLAIVLFMKWMLVWIMLILLLMRIPIKTWQSNVGFRLASAAELPNATQEDRPSYVWPLVIALLLLIAALLSLLTFDEFMAVLDANT